MSTSHISTSWLYMSSKLMNKTCNYSKCVKVDYETTQKWNVTINNLYTTQGTYVGSLSSPLTLRLYVPHPNKSNHSKMGLQLISITFSKMPERFQYRYCRWQKTFSKISECKVFSLHVLPVRLKRMRVLWTQQQMSALSIWFVLQVNNVVRILIKRIHSTREQTSCLYWKLYLV